MPLLDRYPPPAPPLHSFHSPPPSSKVRFRKGSGALYSYGASDVGPPVYGSAPYKDPVKPVSPPGPVEPRSPGTPGAGGGAHPAEPYKDPVMPVSPPGWMEISVCGKPL